MKWLKDILWAAPAWVDRWRIWPRAMITVYLWIVVEVAFWFMGLPNPNATQSAFASAVLGIGAAWFGIYAREPGKDTSPSNQPPHTPPNNRENQ